jgi:hypothetical protein
MIQDEPARNRILAKLKAAGWISGASVLAHAKTPNQISMRIEWTDYGKQRRILYHSIFEELGFLGGRRGGEFDALFEVCRISPYEDLNQSAEAPPEHPRL